MRFVRVHPDHVNVNKASLYAIAINLAQIISALVLALFVLLENKSSMHVHSQLLVLLLTALVTLGAAMDIREAWSLRRMTVKMHALHETVDQMSDLNIALRTQRHDFLNHLQVVYSLMEMDEYKEACAYIEQVYGDIRAVSSSLKTACAPVNALLRAKTDECAQAGIPLQVEVAGAWKELPIPGWEMCRVLSNLIDNARDALVGQKDGRILVKLSEDLRRYAFEVSNNGPMIPPNMQTLIFEPGISQKGEGRGMGLHIARETLRSAGGDMQVESDEVRTVFSGFVPRRKSNEETRKA